MGFSLTIGEHNEVEEDGEIRTVSPPTVKHEKAPAFGEPTDFTNERWPSYSAWDNFMQDSGLNHLCRVYKIHFINGHPGEVNLTKDHQTVIRKAYMLALKDINPENYNIYDDKGIFSRLSWMKYWIDWALENCENPVFYNS